jgi:hypothetical protein
MQIRDIAHFKSGLYLLILLIDNFTVNWFVQCPSRGVLYFGRLTFADCTVTKNRLNIPIYSWRLTIEHDSGTAFGNSFELQALSSSQGETVFNDLLPDNDGVDDFLKSLDIPAQETYSNVPMYKSTCQFPVPMITDCQNITINYNNFPRKWLSFMSLHTFLFYCYSCWIDCLLLKFESYIISIRP